MIAQVAASLGLSRGTGIPLRSSVPAGSQLAPGRAGWPVRAPRKQAKRQIESQASHITNEDIAKHPWASPGWRGAYVSSQPKATQAGIVAAVTLLGAALTYFTNKIAGPWICANSPLMGNYMTSAPLVLGPFIAAVGVIHFTMHEALCSFYPPQGTWGFWCVHPCPKALHMVALYACHGHDPGR